MTIRILSKQDIAALADPEQDMAAIECALGSPCEALSSYVPRTFAGTEEHGWRISIMPGHVQRLESFGVKVQSTTRRAAPSTPVIAGCVLLYAAESGQLTAILDSVAVTARRTAAASGLATRFLAKKDAGELALIGSGVQARAHLPVICAVREISNVRVWSRDPSHAQRLVEYVQESCGLPSRSCPSVHETTEGADIVCAASRASSPIVDLADIGTGAHINSVGAHGRHNRELTTALVAAAKVYVDLLEPVREESGDIAVPVEEGAVTWGHILGDLASLISGASPGRQTEADLTLYKGSGIGITDVAVSRSICDRAEERGYGTIVDW